MDEDHDWIGDAIPSANFYPLSPIFSTPLTNLEKSLDPAKVQAG
jgi:hypothetical protein